MKKEIYTVVQIEIKDGEHEYNVNSLDIMTVNADLPIQAQANEQGEEIARTYLGDGEVEGGGWYSFNGYERAARLFQVKIIETRDQFDFINESILK
jgi:hypothetical protein